MDTSTLLLFLGLLSYAAYYFCCNYSQSWLKPRLPFPPGPPPKWIIGNLLDIPTRSAWYPFTALKKQYDIFSLRSLGKTIIVLNTTESITDLLEKRGTKYSNRPIMPMGGVLMGLDQSTSLLQYDTTWKKHRALAKVALNPVAVQKYIALQEQVIVLFLKSLIDHPENFADSLRLATGRIIMTITYGVSIKRADDEYITDAESLFEKINRVLVPGTYLVDLIPALQYIPAWFPFAKFQREALEGRRQLQSIVDRPYEYVKQEMAAGKASPSIVSDLLNNIEDEGRQVEHDSDHVIRWASGTLYGAGGETTYATVMILILAMAKFPEIQIKAQAEIDRVTGGERLPDINDSSSLPYVGAVIKETLRWYPILPLGFPRISVEEDEYAGYCIPAGSLILPNVWAVSRDEKLHPSPEDFIPERFFEMGPNPPPDPYSYAFGFGRRVCPGRHLAENSLFLLISGILATFQISQSLNESGDEIPLIPVFGTGLISYPEPFACRIVPRSQKAEEIITSRSIAL